MSVEDAILRALEDSPMNLEELHEATRMGHMTWLFDKGLSALLRDGLILVERQPGRLTASYRLTPAEGKR